MASKEGRRRRRKRRRLRKLAEGLRSQAEKARVWVPPPWLSGPFGEPAHREDVARRLEALAEAFDREAAEL